MREELDKMVAAGELPGAIAGVVRNGKILDWVVVGMQDIAKGTPLTEESIFRLYSMSKPITSVAIMILAEQGKLSIDDPATRFLPEFEAMRVYVGGELDEMQTESAQRPITIRDLLTHSSGLTYPFKGVTPVHQYYRQYGVQRATPIGRMPGDAPPASSLDELIARLGKAPLLHQPGEQFEYSYSTTVLGAIVARASAEPLDRFLERHIFAPLKMTDTGFFIEDKDLNRFVTNYVAGGSSLTPIETPEESDYRDHDRLLDGGGALAGTARDYVRFAQMIANSGTLDGVRILSEQSINAMLTPHITGFDITFQPIPFGYGFALGDATSDASGSQPEGTASWAGSANTYFWVDRRTRTVALLMTHVLTMPERMLHVRQIFNRTAKTFLAK